MVVLLSFGEAPDFRGDTLTVHVGGDPLPAASSEKENSKKDGEDTGILSGSFCVDPAWGEGNLNFRALASAGTDGALRISNTVVHNT